MDQTLEDSLPIERFVDLIERTTSSKGERTVHLKPSFVVKVHERILEENKEDLIRGIKTLDHYMKEYRGEGFEGGPSYIHMAGVPGYHFEQRHALALIGIGEALGIWEALPGPEEIPILSEMEGSPYTLGYKLPQ